MSQPQDIQIPHLKADAKIPVTFGTGFVERIQNTLNYLVEGHDEELKVLEKKAGNYSDNNKWEDSVITLITLMDEISKIAQSTEQLEYSSILSIVPGLPSGNQESQ